jgi:hypothetical protein
LTVDINRYSFVYRIPEKSGSISAVINPIHIMGENNLYALSFEVSDSFECFFRLSLIGMNAADVVCVIQPVSNLTLPAKNPSIMAGVAGKIYHRLRHLDKEVQVAR